MRWPWVSRRFHDAELARLEDDVLLALRMAFAEGDPEGWNWTRDAERLWAEVRDSE